MRLYVDVARLPASAYTHAWCLYAYKHRKENLRISGIPRTNQCVSIFLRYYAYSTDVAHHMYFEVHWVHFTSRRKEAMSHVCFGARYHYLNFSTVARSSRSWSRFARRI